MVRIPEHNDWVVYVLLACTSAFVVMLQMLQREATLKDFITQGIADRSNILPSWLLISVVHTLLLATLVSQFVPAVPRTLNYFSVLGYSFNKFGYTFWIFAGLYSLRTFLSYLLYAFIGQGKRFSALSFVVSKYFFVVDVLLICSVFALYFLPVSREQFFYGMLFSLILAFLGKIFFYLFSLDKVLPEEWYYKILYICTLQIAPLLALWQCLFF